MQMRVAKFVVVIFLLLLQASTLAAQISFPKDTDLCQHAPWKLVFHDEFIGTSLDAGKWITYNPTWDNSIADYYTNPPANDPATALHMIKVDDGRSFYSSNNVRVEDGNCILKFRYEPQELYGGSATFSTGKLFHKIPFHSGRFDIRCKIPRASGVWAAFWVIGTRPCDDDTAPGGGEIDFFEYAPCESDLDKVSTTITGYKRLGCDGPTPSQGSHYKLKDIDEWHLFSTEWDRNFVRSYVDGQLKVVQSRFAYKKEMAGCHPGRAALNGQWEKRADFFPYYDSLHNQSLMVELKSSHDLYSVDFLGICTPSLRSRSYIDEHLADRSWVIDYIRVYQRSDNIQAGLRDLCPFIHGPAQILGAPSEVHTYRVENYQSIKNFQWIVADNVKILRDHGPSIDVQFSGDSVSSIGGKWDAAEAGCLEQSFVLPITIVAP